MAAARRQVSVWGSHRRSREVVVRSMLYINLEVEWSNLAVF